MDYYLVPGRKENIQKSIVNNVNKKIKNYSIDQEIFAWGITDQNKCKKYSQIIGKGDMFLIYYTNYKKNISYVGKVVQSIRDPQLCKKIWGEDSKYTYVIILKDKFEVKVSKNDIYKNFDYERLCGITRLSDDKVNIFKKIINEPIKLSNDINNFNNIKQQLINEFWNNKSYAVDVIINNKNSKLKRRNRKKSSKVNRRPISDKYPSKIVGWTGEKVVYDIFNGILKENKNTHILEKLKVNYLNATKVILDWFNQKIDINNLNAEDFSVGKGYDIKFQVDKRLLKFEVKSSFNKINIINLTRNELIEMKKSKEDYYLVLVDNLNIKPRIKFVKNFSDMIKDEYIFMSFEHKLLIDEIDDKYFI